MTFRWVAEHQDFRRNESDLLSDSVRGAPAWLVSGTRSSLNEARVARIRRVESDDPADLREGGRVWVRQERGELDGSSHGWSETLQLYPLAGGYLE